ncbi:hypothetical protein WAF17_18460 [Bernardetia sp. ABR2-2B]|uniref:hypothetical protein n=1 Tax=Bernardetia sp. ABR2-2B TaxID=3127472 RepID=UPI0030CCF6B0
MGYKQSKDTPSMERELNYLLGDLCIKWGFCIPPDDWSEISKMEYYMAENFAKDVVEAEGMNPNEEHKWVRDIAKRFRERFGSNEIDIETFEDRIRGKVEKW